MPACNQVSWRRLDLGNPALTHPTCRPRTSAATDESRWLSMFVAELCLKTSGDSYTKPTFVRTRSATIVASSTTSAVWDYSDGAHAPFASNVNFLCDLDRFVDLDARRLTRGRHRGEPEGDLRHDGALVLVTIIEAGCITSL